jgi:membrane associated rhomboid family serine protease
MPRARFGYPRRRFFSNEYFTPGVKWLLISNTVIFILLSLAPLSVRQVVRPLFALVPEGVVHNFYVWQLFTYLFLHGGPWHLIFNMLVLWMFGVQLERDWGTRRFLKYYFVCGIGAGVCDILLKIATGNWYVPTIGASGAIMGLLLAFGVLYPNQTILMEFLFPIKAKYFVMIYAAVELWASIAAGNSGVSNIAHLGGMATGLIYLKSRLPAMRLRLPDARGAYNRWKVMRAKRKFQTYMRKHGNGPWVN